VGGLFGQASHGAARGDDAGVIDEVACGGDGSVRSVERGCGGAEPPVNIQGGDFFLLAQGNAIDIPFVGEKLLRQRRPVVEAAYFVADGADCCGISRPVLVSLPLPGGLSRAEPDIPHRAGYPAPRRLFCQRGATQLARSCCRKTARM